jgi:hypothetical protein
MTDRARIAALPTVCMSELDKALARLGAGVRAKEARRLAKYCAAYADHNDKEIEERDTMAREEKAKASPRASLPPRPLYAEAKPLTDSEKATLRAGQRSRQARGHRPVTLAKVAE